MNNNFFYNKIYKDTKNIFFHKIIGFDHENVFLFYDKLIDLQFIIAIHSTVLGPAIGGLRIFNYSSIEYALIDVLNLSKSMTYKASISGLKLGGAKAIIIGNLDKSKMKIKFLLKKYGSFINYLNGYYITASDLNVSLDFLKFVSNETKYVLGLPLYCNGSGNSSFTTAFGVYIGMKAAVKEVFGNDSLKNKKILLEGVGNVGKYLINYLCKEGAKVYIIDVLILDLLDIINKYPIKIINISDINNLDFDIYSPCALGFTINNNTIKKMNFKIIAGSANNQFESIKNSRTLFNNNILHVPDFLISSGGLINVYFELYGNYNRNNVYSKIENIYNISLDIFKKSKFLKISPQEVAINDVNKKINYKKLL